MEDISESRVNEPHMARGLTVVREPLHRGDQLSSASD